MADWIGEPGGVAPTPEEVKEKLWAKILGGLSILLVVLYTLYVQVMAYIEKNTVEAAVMSVLAIIAIVAIAFAVKKKK